MVLKADEEASSADVQRQVVAVRSGETVPMNKSPVGESQSNRVQNAVHRVQNLIRTLQGALEKSFNTRVK